ncbi:CASP-like protein 4B1, partial [Mucuna pruriens]
MYVSIYLPPGIRALPTILNHYKLLHCCSNCHCLCRTPHSNNQSHHATTPHALFTRASLARTVYPETSLTSITILPSLPPLHKQTNIGSSHSYFLFHLNSLKSESETIRCRMMMTIHVQTPPMADSAPSGDHQTRATGAGGIAGILRRWKREDLIKRGSLALRGIALLFSLISFVITASNKHGDWRQFDHYEEYRYLLAIAILSSLYTGCQAFRQIQELSTAKQLLKPRMAAMVDFLGDQIIAYLLISSASSAIPLTNRMREGADNIFTDSSAAAITMSIFAFMCLAVSAVISGYKLSTQPYI